MHKNEALTDLWVYELLKEAEIKLSPKGSFVKEINDALKTASKSGTGNVGFPEYCGIVGNYLIVIENKADLSKHIKLNENNVITNDVKSIREYAVNGALFYGKHLANNTSYNKIIAFGISGDQKKHRITPIYIDERCNYKELDDVETFTLFNKKNIDEFYTTVILKEPTPKEKTTDEILKDARTLHEDLRNYGSIQDKDKPLVVSGILLALREMEFKGFSLDTLNGDDVHTDGEKIYEAVEKNLKRADVSPVVKREKLLSQFLVIKDTKAINEINEFLGKTPLKHYTEFLFKNIYNNIKYIQSAEDYLGRFYGEFMSYSGGDGQNLGIVLTPKHITELFCDLANLKSSDNILDPCCGTGGFLIAAMHDMLAKADKISTKRLIRRNQLHGLELQPYMFTIATTNMILRGDGKSNLEQEDFLKQNPARLQEKGYNIGMMNPPYSMGTKSNPSLYEISFTEHLLNTIVQNGKVIVIVPQSSMTGKTKEERDIKRNILKNHSLEGVITLNKNTFYGVGTNPCIAVFTAGVPHDPDSEVKFINFEDDGFEIQKHRGLVATLLAKDKKQHLLDVWFNRVESPNKFCVKTIVDSEDEWLHSFYYFNDEIPTNATFEKTIGDYLTFEFSMTMQGRGDIFSGGITKNLNYKDHIEIPVALKDKKWKDFLITDVVDIISGRDIYEAERSLGNTPYVSSTANNNGIGYFVNNLNSTLEKDCLSVNRNGSVGYSFYHPYEALFSNDCRKLRLKKKSRGVGFFLSNQITMQKDKYGYGYKMGTGRLQKQKIMLPINEKDEPDYIYMEQYIRYLEMEKLKKYLSTTNR